MITTVSRLKKNLLHVFLSLLLVLILAHCSSNDGPEAVVKQFIADFEAVIEDRDYRGIKDFISEQYSDEQNRTRQDITSIAAGYMFRNKSIHVLTRIESVESSESTITASILAAVAGRPIDDVATLPSLNADMYLVDVVLDASGKSVLLLSGSWRQAMLDDFLSE